MNATSCHESLRDIATTARDFRDRVAAADVGRRLDIPTSTVTRRDERHETILQWTASDFLTLARGDELLGRVVRDFLSGNKPAALGSVAAIVQDIADDIDSSSDLHRVAFKGIADGVLERHELISIRAAILRRQTTDANLLRDVDPALNQRTAK